LAEPDRILVMDSISIKTPCPRQSKQFRPSWNANISMEFDSEFDSDEEDITSAVDCGCEHALVKAKTIQLVFAASPLRMYHVEVRSERMINRSMKIQI
jgi:hypothetical protein